MKSFIIVAALLASSSVSAPKVLVATTPFLFSVSTYGQATDSSKGISCEMAKIDAEAVSSSVCQAKNTIYKKTILPSAECVCVNVGSRENMWDCRALSVAICATKGIIIRKEFVGEQ